MPKHTPPSKSNKGGAKRGLKRAASRVTKPKAAAAIAAAGKRPLGKRRTGRKRPT